MYSGQKSKESQNQVYSIKSFSLKIISIFFLVVFCGLIDTVDAHVAIPDGSALVCEDLDSTDLMVHSANQIDSRLTLSSPSDALPVYTSRIFSTSSDPWTRNPNSWTQKGSAALDFTGVAAYKSTGTSTIITTNQGLATLISPRNFIAAHHYGPSTGDVLGFIDADGNRVERTVMGRYRVAESDILIGVLDSDVPDSITYYPIMASTTLMRLAQPYLNYNQYGNQAQDLLPMVVFDAEAKAIVHNLNAINSVVSHNTYTTGSRSSFSENIASGDSGNPGFLIIDNRPILLFTHQSTTGGPNPGNFISEINAGIDALGYSGIHITQYVNNCFVEREPNFIPTLIPSYLLSYVHNPIHSATSTVTSFSAVDQDVGHTLNFSVIGLTTSGTTTPLLYSDFFTISTTTTTLSFHQKVSIDPDIYGSYLTVRVAVEDVPIGNMYVGSSTASKMIFISNDQSLSDGAIVYDSKFSYGSNMTPTAVEFDPDGLLFVKDEGNTKVLKFDSEGNYVGEFNGSTTPLHSFDLNYDIAFDSGGYMYMSDQDVGYVLKMNPTTGAYISTIGSAGASAGQYVCPSGLAFDSVGNLLVTDACGNKIIKYNSSGTYVSEFGSIGSGDGQFSAPTDIEIDALGNLYIADFSNNRIQVFTSNGDFVSKFGILGTNQGQFYGPIQLRIDPSGYIYVADTNNSRIQKFDHSGNFVTQFGGLGSQDDHFNQPYTIELDSNNDILVGDLNNHAIKKFIQLTATGAPDLETSSDTGKSNQDNVTTDNTPAFTVSCINTRTVELIIDDQVVGTSTCVAGSASITASSLSVGLHTVTAKQGNSVGVSESSGLLVVEISGSSSSSSSSSSSGGGGGSTKKTNSPISPLTPTNTLPGLSNNTLDIKPLQSRNMTLGTQGSEVVVLQKYLNQKGFVVSAFGPGSIGNESMYYGIKTKSALARFQVSVGIKPALGYFGPLTRKYILEH